jgi:quinol monooxygenase YgiN
MITFMAMLKARPGKEKRVEEILKGMIPNVQDEKGTSKYILQRSKEDPSQFLFYEEYVDQVSLDFHNSTVYFKKLGADLNGLLDGEPKVIFYDVLAAISRSL